MKIDTIIEIYEELRRNSDELSMRKFASDYLGRSESYLFATKYYGRDISDKAIVLLARNLRALSTTWFAIYNEDRTRTRSLENGQRLKRLSDKAADLLLAP